MPTLKNPQLEAMCQHYAIGNNKKAAALHAGFSPSVAASCSRIFDRQEVKDRIAEIREGFKAPMTVDADMVLAMWWSFVTTDSNEFSQNRVGACRFCHGIDFAYQWKTQREFKAACAEARAKFRLDSNITHDEDERVPSDRGGFGYKITYPPNDLCPECAGVGEQWVHFPDTKDMKDEVRKSYLGTRVSKNGIEVKTVDKEAALLNIARAIGMFSDNKPADVSDDTKAFLAAIMGQKAPIS